MGLLNTRTKLTWTHENQPLRSFAEAVHEAIRARVIESVERGDQPVFVCCGVATPPGPVQLIFEDRRKGLPGREFRGVLARDGGSFSLTLEESRMRPIPQAYKDEIEWAVRAARSRDERLDWASA